MRNAYRCAALLLLAHVAMSRTGSAGEVVHVKITDLAYAPAEITIRTGDTVEWTNEDFIDHTATATDNAYDVFIGAGQSARVTFNRAGTSTYYCRVHPDMTGTVRVVDGH